MKIEIRPVETDEDLEAWRQVRIAILPNERTSTVEEIRRAEAPGQLLVLAEIDGELVGSGVAGRSGFGGHGFVAPRVLPGNRRRGVGSALIARLAEHVETLGFTRASSNVDDAGSLEFAKRFGFREHDRQVEQVRRIAGDEGAPTIPDGIEFISLADRPELFARTYHELAVEALEDFAVTPKLEISYEDWEREWITCPEGSFVALSGDEIVGCAGLVRDYDRPDRAENSLTAVRRDWRRRGLATALKRRTIAWAAANGLSELYTWTQTGNEGMQAVNERLGYVTRAVSITVRGSIPLP
ncbi:MAG: GNAT family N-acetyltransferase [Actinomycetota bacterium]|nr:GNAT family N-acetyltransferase [Actinomycetota bacterium]